MDRKKTGNRDQQWAETVSGKEPAEGTPQGPTYEELFCQAKARLTEAEASDAPLDAWYLLSDTFGISRADYLWRKKDRPYMVPAAWYERIERRAKREPLAYILGNTEFMGLPFLVEPGVLIPRQDTETLTEWVLEECACRGEGQEPLSILDMCAGSGCIGLSLERLGGFRVTLSDLSQQAAAVAGRNRDALGCQARVFCGDLFEALLPGESFDIIVCNPPYIETAVISGLMPEVRDYEPRSALDGDEDGLHFYRRLARESKDWLKPGGRIYMEIGYDQGLCVPALFQEAGFRKIEVRRDLAGNDRVVRGVLPDV